MRTGNKGGRSLKLTTHLHISKEDKNAWSYLSPAVRLAMQQSVAPETSVVQGYKNEACEGPPQPFSNTASKGLLGPFSPCAVSLSTQHSDTSSVCILKHGVRLI